jgi:holo-[acyl-carrier protein] synthase
MIYGIGTDIVEIDRIKDINKLAQRILSESEEVIFRDLGTAIEKQNFLAKQWAGKEAIAKAFGTGFKSPISINEISLLRDSIGKPCFKPSKKLIKTMDDLGISKSHVSLADEKNYAIAFAVLEK